MSSSKPVRLAYTRHEPATGTDESLAPIIYLHGLSASKESWGDIPQVVANATRRMTYSVDARDHGDSEWTNHFNFDINADDLIHFMDTFGIKKAILVGHSMGGMTSIKTALKRPDKVEMIVVEDMFVRNCSREIIDDVRIFIDLIRQGTENIPPELDENPAQLFVMQHVAKNVPPHMTMVPKSQDFEEEATYVALRRDAHGRWVRKSNLVCIVKALENYETLSSQPEGKFDGPALFIYGKISPFLVGADEHHIRKFFPKAVFEGIEEADHDIHNVKTVEFADAVIKFISSTGCQ